MASFIIISELFRDGIRLGKRRVLATIGDSAA